MANIIPDVTDWTPCDRIRTGDDVVRTAIGDVHGEADQLAAILDMLPADADVTMLGDVGDRGPDSVGAWRLVGTGPDRFATFALLPGNHDAMLIGTLLDTRGLHANLLGGNGGLWVADLVTTADLENNLVAEPLRRAIGDSAFALLTQDGAALRRDPYRPQATMHRRIGNVVLVHAGVAPGEDPAAWCDGLDLLDVPRDERHPLWIRDEFLEHEEPFGMPGQDLFAIHGHTIESTTIRSTGQRNPSGVHEHEGWRLGIDGGSFKTGIVTACQFRDGAYRIITARRNGGRQIRMD